MNLNESILHFFNNYAGKWNILDTIAKNTITFIPIVMCAIIAIIYFIGIIQKNLDYRHIAVSTFFFLVINLIIGYIISHIYYKPRPLFAEKGTINAPVSHVDDSSFPSDHMTITTSLTFGISSTFKILRYIFIVCTIIIGIDKIFLGHHYPLDILLTVVYVCIMRIIYNVFISKHIIKFYDFIENKFKRIIVNK
ncbi:MAG: phosphatase PAP2 family protein [Oscillospiraceae bacterium]|nr:phosphatase PAP2 family protein [Oscillospiraceae bacterium]